MSENIETEQTETTDEQQAERVETTDEQQAPDPEQDAPDTFPRKVVEDLRREAARYRDRAKGADELRAALWEARVAATGRLTDPTDLPLPDDADPLDSEAVTTAVEALLERKPHLAARRVVGAVGQGENARNTNTDLAGILRGLA